MARIRTHKPEFWTSEQVTDCSIEARLLFMGLLNFVDDGGRMPYSPRRIKGQIYPHDNFTSDDIQRMVDELSRTIHGDPLVFLYDVDGKRYLEITGFTKHQIVQHPTYLYPDRNGVVPEYVRPSRENGTRPVREWSRSGPYRRGREGKGKEEKGKEGKGGEEKSARSRAPPSHPPQDDWPDDYREQFERLYPQKVRMAAALKILEGVRNEGKVTWRFLAEQLRAYAGKSDDAYWASPTNWLNEERWNDQPANPPAKPAADVSKRRTLAGRAAERVREMEAGERAAAPDRAPGEVGGAEIGGDHARVVPAAPGE